ncbi:hypothetical protein C1H76_3962 [Elsinoe australis]|uniref:Uncharacterized protein n=1 Tax=Elsinoe australis TaxID=40998 RepID=A0A4U7B7B4_9PEZI|nr:hypothetical protein C1H76_3962 [Elsinoe australis]
MFPDAKVPPPSYEDAIGELSTAPTLEPADLLLTGSHVSAERGPETPLYQLGWDVTSTSESTQKSSATFERVQHVRPEKAESTAPLKQQNQLLFYLAHDADVQDGSSPAYYITSATADMLGNISLESTKSKLGKSDFKCLLSVDKTAKDAQLFDPHPQSLFEVKSKMIGGRYSWTNSGGEQIAYEEAKNDQHKLVVTASLEEAKRDALVATWCLRLWHDTAESRLAKREAMERWTSSEGLNGYQGMKMAKRVGAMGAVGGGAA